MVYALTFLFLLIDLGSKLLAETANPNNLFFKLSYNPNMALGFKTSSIELNFFINFILPFLLMPLLFATTKEIKNSNLRMLFTSLAFAGAIGNTLGRFSEGGVIDFINCHFFICNIADLYGWVAIVIFYIDFKNQKQKAPLLSVSK